MLGSLPLPVFPHGAPRTRGGRGAAAAPRPPRGGAEAPRPKNQRNVRREGRTVRSGRNPREKAGAAEAKAESIRESGRFSAYLPTCPDGALVWMPNCAAAKSIATSFPARVAATSTSCPWGANMELIQETGRNPSENRVLRNSPPTEVTPYPHGFASPAAPASGRPSRSASALARRVRRSCQPCPPGTSPDWTARSSGYITGNSSKLYTIKPARAARVRVP